MTINNSGIRPVGISVLVLPEQIEQFTESGIQISTDKENAREEMAQTDGLVIAIAPAAFDDEAVARCEVGDRVIMAKFAGMVRKGKDGLTYRLIRDHDVVAILEKDEK